MKAILFASVAGALLFALATWRLRRLSDRNGAAALLVSFLIILPLLVVAYLLAPADLWFLPIDLQIRPPALDFVFALFLYATGFFGGILQLYNLAERGFSLRILIDIMNAPKGAMTIDELMHGYSGGRGIAWMYKKRLADMAAIGMVASDNNRVALTQRGYRIAGLFSQLQYFVRAEEL